MCLTEAGTSFQEDFKIKLKAFNGSSIFLIDCLPVGYELDLENQMTSTELENWSSSRTHPETH